MAGHTTSLVTFLEFADDRQLMLRRFDAQLAELSRAQLDPRDEFGLEKLCWQLDETGVVVGRVVGRNRRELARTARTFPSLEKARRTARALVAAGDRLTVHVVRSGVGFTWFVSLYGSPALVGVQRCESVEAAESSAELALRQLGVATVATTSKKLPVAGTGPLSVDPCGAPSFPSSQQGRPRPENGMPASNHLDTGTRG